MRMTLCDTGLYTPSEGLPIVNKGKQVKLISLIILISVGFFTPNHNKSKWLYGTHVPLLIASYILIITNN